ncbi:MAG: tyrosine--tRNA ligase, partial [Spirochaetes bacterium]|nr:tyrosine--tRNA ligase [Spirochaetota bacterium]
MNDLLQILNERGFIAQNSNEDGIKELLKKESSVYIGFDPTAASLHIGSLVPIMALAHLQRCGHKPLVLVGGGTALIGDPSGKTELRKMLSKDDINTNAEAIKSQLSRYIDFENDKALLLNNADWLSDLNYIEFLRDIGMHFSVNRMIAAESYKQRLETGLSFIEFNYMIFQAYDFLYLAQKHNCRLQMGGNDQWGNIVAGIDLIRRIESKEGYGLTFPLITTSSGAKMGKTASGAVWLDSKRTSPYEFYQYWRNTEDPDVKKFLALFTFLPMDEVNKLGDLKGEELNEAKKILAYEATKITHGEEEAKKAGNWLVNMPEVTLSKNSLESGIPVIDAFTLTGICPSKGEARR